MERLKRWKLSALLLLTLVVPMAYLPVAYASFGSREYCKLTIGAWTEECHYQLRTRVEVSYQTIYGYWVDYENHWTSDIVLVAKDTRAYVFLREDSCCHEDYFLFWDNYGIARGPEGNRNWYLDMTSDRTMVATYRKVPDLDYPVKPGYCKLVIKAWTEECHRELRVRVEVCYRTIYGQWVEHKSYWTPVVIYVVKNTRAYVFLGQDPTCQSTRFLFWDNYGIARGPEGNRNWYLDVTSDRTMVATYRG